MTNPLLQDYIVPDYDAIEPEHFAPAYDRAIEEIRRNAALIKKDDAAPSFENTIDPLADLFLELGRISLLFSAFEYNRSNDRIAALAQPLSLKVSAIVKEIFQDQELAARFLAVYEMNRDADLPEDEEKLLDSTYRLFENNGSFLQPEDQKTLNDIDNELITHSDAFKRNMEDSVFQQALLFTDEKELAGVPEDTLSSFRDNAQKVLKGLKPDAEEEDREIVAKLPPAIVEKIRELDETGRTGSAFLYLPERLLVDKLLFVAEDKGFREKITKALNRIGAEPPYDNEGPVREIQRLRQERTALLNRARNETEQYRHYVDYAMAPTMAGSIEAVEEFFDRLERPLLGQFERDIKTLEAFAASKGETGKLEPWDIPYWTNRYKQETWNFNSAEYSRYFEIENVIRGFRGHASRQFNLCFEPADDKYPKLHPDERLFDAYDNDTGEYMGILKMDLFARSGKRGGAWAAVIQKKTDSRPGIYVMNANFGKPEAGKPVLMDAGQYLTTYHEGGHGLNQLMGTRSRYALLHGTGGLLSFKISPMDFVENHSTAQEKWAGHKDVLQSFAGHHKDGTPLPEDLIERKRQSDSFMQAREHLLVIQNSRRDFLFHSMKPEDYKDTDDIHRRARLDSPYADHIRPYPFTRFHHLFDKPLSPYAAGYYGYIYSDSCAAQIFSMFETAGLYDGERSRALKEYYRDGAATFGRNSFRRLTGKDPSPAAFMKELGIAPKEDGRGPQAANETPPPRPV